MKMQSRAALLVCAVAATSLVAPALACAAQYNITQIPTLDAHGTGDGFIKAQSISSNGLITGYYQVSTPSWGTVNTAFTAQVSGGTVSEQSLGYVGGNLDQKDPNYTGQQSWGFAVNSSGTVAGSATADFPFVVAQASGGAVQSLGVMQPYASVYPTYGLNFAAAITDSGTMVGGSWQGAGGVNRLHAFAYSNGAYTDLATDPRKMSAAYGVSPAGTTVAGFETTSTGNNGPSGSALTTKVAAKWTLSGSTWSATSLGALPGGTQSVAFGVNAKGQVVGCAEANPGQGLQGDAFLCQPDGTMVDLGLGFTGNVGGGSLGNLVGASLNSAADNIVNYGLGNAASCADAINSSGQVVGYYGGSIKRAFLATVDDNNVVTFLDLNTLIPQDSGWVLQEATSINDAGQIVGYGSFNGTETSFELDLAAVTVPEPTTMVVPGMLVAGALASRRRR